MVFRKAATESGAAFGRLGNALLDLPFIGFKWLAIGSMGAAGLSALLLVPVLLARVGYFLYSAIWYRAVCDLNWVTITQFEFSFPCEIDTQLDGLDIITSYLMKEMDMSLLMLAIAGIGLPMAIAFGWLSTLRKLES